MPIWPWSPLHWMPVSVADVMKLTHRPAGGCGNPSLLLEVGGQRFVFFFLGCLTSKQHAWCVYWMDLFRQCYVLSLWAQTSLASLLFYSTVFYSKLFPSTGSSHLPECPNFLCPLLSLSIRFHVAPQCHLSNGVFFFQMMLRLYWGYFLCTLMGFMGILFYA